MAQIVKAFVCGGGQRVGHIVDNRAAMYARRNPACVSRHFSWTAGDGIRAFLKQQPAGPVVSFRNKWLNVRAERPSADRITSRCRA